MRLRVDFDIFNVFSWSQGQREPGISALLEMSVISKKNSNHKKQNPCLRKPIPSPSEATQNAVERYDGDGVERYDIDGAKCSFG